MEINVKFDLPKLDFKFLVAGHNRIMHLDLMNQTSRIFHDSASSKAGIASYYGITWSKDNIYIVGTPTDCVELNRVRTLLLCLDKDGNALYNIAMPPEYKIAHIHQIQCYENKLFLVDSKRNAIRIFDLEDQTWFTFYPDPNRIDRDTDHFNSIWFDNDEEKMYIISHGKDNTQIRVFNPSQLWIFDANTFSFIEKKKYGEFAHNVVKYKDKMLVCSSKNNVILSDSNEVFLEVGPHPRGMVIHEPYLFVGKSETAGKEWRSELTGYIEAFDLSTMKSIGEITIPNIGQVYEIRCLNQMDHAHNGVVLWD